MVEHEIIDESNQFDLNIAARSIDSYLKKIEGGLSQWSLNTKLGIYDPASNNSALMSDSEVRQIMNKDTLTVKIEEVPKVDPPYGTNVTIEKLLYFPANVNSIDDIKRAVEDNNDGINLNFSIQKNGDQYIYETATNLKGMSLNNELEYAESSEGNGRPTSCSVNQDKLTLSINFNDHRMWLGPCILLKNRDAQQ